MKAEREPELKVVRHYWGLSWPTLIVGALTFLAIALSYLYVINTAVVTGN